MRLLVLPLAVLLTAPPLLAQQPPALPVAASAPAVAASAPPPAATPPRAPGAPAPFAEVTKDATRRDGFLPVWTRDEKTWIEIPAGRLDKPFFLGASLASGLGERAFLPGLMGPERVVVLRRVGNSVQLVARNLHARAPEGTPLARAVAESFSDSLLASAPLAAAPQAQNKALLVDAMALLGGDLTGLQTHLEGAYRMPYALDRANSSIERTRVEARFTALTVRGHYAVPKLPAPPVLAPGAPPPNPAALPSPSRVLPDARSLFLDVAYTLAALPEQPMRTRAADQRVGFFTTAFVDLSRDDGGNRRSHVIERWRLEKKDPAAAVSEPREPIRVVMDRNIPLRWRDTVRAGILEWNKAFERAGFKDAIVVEQQPDDASGSSVEGVRLLSVRWFAIDGPGAVAVGPSQADPRTGEILRAAAIIPENWVRLDRGRLVDTEPRLPGAAAPGADAAALPAFAPRLASCAFADGLLLQAQAGLALLLDRGALDPDSPEAERYIAQSLKAVTMHEVGHALGLRHNFRASTAVTAQQLRDPAYTAQHGLASSVMDYAAVNLPLEGEAVADYFMGTLGDYDFWAIEYGYREHAPEAEAAALAAHAARGDREPVLAYATDEDAGAPLDPRVNLFDLGQDPLAHVQRELRLVRELWDRTQRRALGAEDDLTVYRRNLQRGFALIGQALPTALKHLGGSLTTRAKAGADQALLAPVPAARQREALALVLGQLFDSGSFRFDPRFMTRLGVDQLDRLDPARRVALDFSLGGAVAALQRTALDTLMSDALAQRLADAEPRSTDPAGLMTYVEVQQRLWQAVWSETAAPRPAGRIDTLRRTLQREHLRRLGAGLLRPVSTMTADVRAVHRQAALALQAQLRKSLAAGRWDELTRAHLDDCLAVLGEALKAPLARQGV
ncbi:MAG: zinc-dependent metalloprotease [Rubrivivax sp.]